MPDGYEAVLFVKKKGEAAGSQGPYFEFTLAKNPDDKGIIYRSFSTTDADKIHVGGWYKLTIVEKPMKEGKGVFRNVEGVIGQVDAPGSQEQAASKDGGRDGLRESPDQQDNILIMVRRDALAQAVGVFDESKDVSRILRIAAVFEGYLLTGQVPDGVNARTSPQESLESLGHGAQDDGVEIIGNLGELFTKAKDAGYGDSRAVLKALELTKPVDVLKRFGAFDKAWVALQATKVS